jgi:ribonuclease PH
MADLEQPTPDTPAAKPETPRPDGRLPGELRPVRFRNGFAPHATGSTLIEWGHTRVICAAMVEETVPRWMKEQGVPGGWVTAEYSMLPYSTLQRKVREVARGRQEGRSQEIQRLIGRSMRAAVDLAKLGARTVWVDCDVLQADGGTRTAAITGGYVALALAVRKLQKEGLLKEDPFLGQVAAVSVGVVAGRGVLDLDYCEDSTADVDFNVVMTSGDRFVEIQGTGERDTFSEEQLGAMLALARAGIQRLMAAQREALDAAE